MNKRHAYLILAHNEFEILRVLLSLLDDERNDIFIHFDKKTTDIPIFNTFWSTLYILDDREDIRWGHVSQIRAEMHLLKFATSKSDYAYYHIISGTHLPLTSQDNIHTYFEENLGKEIFQPIAQNDNETFEKMKLYNFFMSTFLHNNTNIALISQRIRQVLLRVQKLLKVDRNKDIHFHKASNWVSITHAAAVYLVSREPLFLKRYSYTMCGDEFFVPTELALSNKFLIKYDEKLLKQEFVVANTREYTNSDYEMLSTCNALFARKFTSKDRKIVERIIKNIRK